MKNAYKKYTKMHAKFVPYLVRNSLHFCSVFLSKIMVLKVHYFEDHPQNRWWKVHYFEDHPQNGFEMHNSVRITRNAYFGPYSYLRITHNKIGWSVWGSSSKVSTVNIRKAAAGTEYVGAPPCLQAITCTHLKPYFYAKKHYRNVVNSVLNTEQI